MAVSDWSTTAAENTSPSPNGWPEGMLPSGINDTARQMMADIKSWYTAFFLGRVSTPSAISASTQNDYAPDLTDVTVLRLSASVTTSLTGIAGGTNGRVLLLVNVGSNHIFLVDEDTGSSAANRFAHGGVSDLISLTPDKGCIVWYDGTSSRWRAFSQ